jgi:hypothetical protein
MIDLVIAMALAAQGQMADRHDHGRAYFQLRITRHLPGRETIFELYEVGSGRDRTLLVERRIEELGGGSRHDVTVRDCSSLGAAVEELTRLQMPALFIEGIGPPASPGDGAGTTYAFSGFVGHPNRAYGEVSLTSYHAGDSAPSDPLRDWADGLASVFEACLEQG